MYTSYYWNTKYTIHFLRYIFIFFVVLPYSFETDLTCTEQYMSHDVMIWIELLMTFDCIYYNAQTVPTAANDATKVYEYNFD